MVLPLNTLSTPLPPGRPDSKGDLHKIMVAISQKREAVMKKIFCVLLALAALSGCELNKTGAGRSLFNFSQDGKHGALSKRDDTTCNASADAKTKAVLRYIAALSGDNSPRVLSGQSCGHTINIYKPGDMMGYTMMAENLQRKTGKWPSIIALDYEHDEICSAEELSKANAVLIKYWNEGGLIAVGWSPQNPWVNDESDLENNPGNWKNTRTYFLSDEQNKMIDLNDLIDPDKAIYKVWRRKLDRIAAALQELQNAGVVVIFKPIQEMNGSWFWWGVSSHREDPSPYINLYRDMYSYFTEVKGLNNIIWLYSPYGVTNTVTSSDMIIYRQMWNYPGDDYIDIVAPTAYNNGLSIAGYEELIATGKPLAMAEYGPDQIGNHGCFDNRIYIQRLSKVYPAMAFWISWHDWNNGDRTNTYMSITGNRYPKQLMQNPLVLTREDVVWKKYLSAN